MGQPVIQFEIIGKDAEKFRTLPRRFMADLNSWMT